MFNCLERIFEMQPFEKKKLNDKNIIHSIETFDSKVHANIDKIHGIFIYNATINVFLLFHGK